MNASAPRLTAVAPVLHTPDLDRALAWYRDTLGFEVGFVHAGTYAELRRDGCALHLRCATLAPRDQDAFEAGEHLDACFAVDDAAALAARFADAGARFSVALRRMPYGWEFYVRDPDGHILGFVQAGAG